MEKRNDLNIYIMGFKPLSYGYWDNSLYTPIECGYATRTEHFTGVTDDFEGGISKYNDFYLENTALYYIWKNVHTPFKGQCQYRRRLEFDAAYDFRQDFEKYDVIAAKPFKFNIRHQYETCHFVEDLDRLIDIIKEDDPNADDFFLRINNLYYSNGFIMPASLYDEYCEFLFSTLNKWLERGGYKTPLDVESDVKTRLKKTKGRKDAVYQTRIGGYLSERIFSYWVWKKHLRVKEINYKTYEGVK